MHDYAVIGGGIVGLAVAYELTRQMPGCTVVLLEKERSVGLHQSGRNSGVIHSGIYYKPGSLRAKLGREGNRAMVAFCREHGIAHEVCGKLIAAVEESELPGLRALAERAKANGIEARLLTAPEAREIEPHLSCRQALLVPSAGIADFPGVCRKLEDLIETHGGSVVTGAGVSRILTNPGSHWIITARGDFEARFIIACAGLQSDRVAKMGDLAPGARIIPFRGEYFELRPERRSLVRNLIYPVPNPEFPFLGVHFTRGIDGHVHAGPNAVLSYARERYSKFALSPSDMASTFTWPGFWRMAAAHWRFGLTEMLRSISKRRFVETLQRLVPEVRSRDLVRAESGIRAQALKADGTLVDDFLVLEGERSLHVCNAPSPAATASLEIACYVVGEVARVTSAVTVRKKAS
ncbi:MAG TPA: L-2-hydroxyglutarate oxidase [Thermoanaerobaculia bacterium]|nr:L-2-hydroxyglutarate oxidase [Thermoanaerobaculia bacterium]